LQFCCSITSEPLYAYSVTDFCVEFAEILILICVTCWTFLCDKNHANVHFIFVIHSVFNGKSVFFIVFQLSLYTDLFQTRFFCVIEMISHKFVWNVWIFCVVSIIFCVIHEILCGILAIEISCGFWHTIEHLNCQSVISFVQNRKYSSSLYIWTRGLLLNNVFLMVNHYLERSQLRLLQYY
jgi:hypothetical protein